MKQPSETPDVAPLDLAFPITQGPVPIDHGYALYAALSHALPVFHRADWLAVHPLGGRRLGNSTLMLTRGSELVLRLPAERIAVALELNGKTIRLSDQVFLLGAPTVRALTPNPELFARRVAIRLTKPPRRSDGSLDIDSFRAEFEKEALRQLAGLGVDAQLRIVAKKDLAVKTQTIVAFALQLSGLSDVDSMTIQAHGLGGKRRMGCGVFRPIRQSEQEQVQ